MAAKEWYKDWFSSPFYHKLYFDRDEKEAQAFLDHLLQYFKPAAGSRMLDAGCGKGRHAQYLAQKGFDVTGIDLSFESITEAMKMGDTAPGGLPNLHFYQHDMRLLFWVNYFDYVFNFFTSFGYFHTRREHDDALRTLSAGLKPGGFMLFDYLNVHYSEENLVPHEMKTANGSTYEIHRWQDENYFFKKIIVQDAALSEKQEFTEQVAKFSLGDFTDMFSFQKIQVVDVFGNYEFEPYHVSRTPRMIIVGRKS